MSGTAFYVNGQAMKKMVCLLLLLFGVQGCGIQMTYTNLDWIIPLYIDDYISLNQGQRGVLEARLQRVLDWHCRTQLPFYARTLTDLANDINDPRLPLHAGQLKFYANQFTSHWRDLKTQIGPEIADILATASNDQLEELFDNLERRNHAYRSKFVAIAPGELQKKRTKKITAGAIKWLSDLTPQQRQVIVDWSAAIEPLAADALKHRQRMLAELRTVLAKRSHSSNFKNEVVDLLVNSDQYRTKAYQEKIDVNMDRTLAMLRTINRSLTPDQRSFLKKRMNGLVATLDKLSCDPAMAHLSI